MRVAETRITTTRRMKSLLLRTILLGALCAGLASPAWAATVSKLRVGQHADFTRVVFELDSRAGYRLERSTEAGKPVVVVTLDADLSGSVPRSVRSGSSLLESVSIDSAPGRTVATLRLRRSGLPIKELLLGSPPRIVLDVLGEDTALAQAKKAPAPAPRTVAQKTEPAPAPEPKAKPEPEKPSTPEPAPKQVAKAETPKTPTPRPQAAPAEPRTEPEAEPGTETEARKTEPAETPTPAPAAEPEPDAAAATATRDQEAERAAREAMERRLAAVREAAEKRKAQLRSEKQKKQAEAAPAPDSDGAQGGSNMLLVGGVAGLLAVLLIVAVALSRRRRALPKNLDVTSLSDDEPEAPSREVRDEPFGVPGVPDTDEDESAAAPREPLVAGEPTAEPPLSAPGLFDDLEKGESAMETQVQDLPAERGHGPAGAAEAASDIGRVVAELERRMAQLESKLDESNAARERLERQVAAQSEELRVQRAAIARTQRALRGLTRSDEDHATEPAIRE
jgi:hypothetical protein